MIKKKSNVKVNYVFNKNKILTYSDGLGKYLTTFFKVSHTKLHISP